MRRLGEFVFPVELEVVFDSGDTLREHWDGKALWKKFKYIRPDKLVYATVDPDHKIPLDINFTNNSRLRKPVRKGINKQAFRLMFLVQFLLDQPEIVNLYTNTGIRF